MAFFNVSPKQQTEALTPTFENGFNTSVREADAQPGMFEGDIFSQIGAGVSSGFNRSVYNLYTDENRRTQIADSISKLRPDPKTVGSAGQMIFGIADPLSFIATEFLQDPITSILSAPSLAFNVTKNYEPAQTALNIADGMDPKTASEVARTQATAMGLGSILPVSVAGNIATRVLSGGALNVLVGAGERAETGRILRANGYEEMARQYSALDGTAAAAEFVLGGIFGGAFGARPRLRVNPEAVLPSQVDAALTGNQSVHAAVDVAPGIPVDGRSAQAHTQALNTAIESLAFGDKVNVENILADAGFLGKTPDFNAVAVIRNELQKAGFNDVANQVRQLEEAARNRGLYVEPSDLNVVLNDAPSEIKVGGIKGMEAAVKIGNDYVPVEYRLVEAGDVRATMGKSDNQYRDRTRAASEQQIAEAAANLDPRLLAESWTMESGAPVLTADGKIIAGNGRAAFIERAYDTNSGSSYIDYLKENSQSLGLSAREIDGMQRPMLVRVLQRDVDVNKAAILSNEMGGLGMSALEQAKVDGERLGNFSAISVGEDGSLSNVSNMPFIRSWVGEFPTNQRSRLMDADGRLSAEGARRLQNAVLYRAYGDSPVLSRLIESTDPGSRNIASALTRVAARVADTKEAIARGELYPFDLSDDLVSAVEKFDTLRTNGMGVNEWVNQIDAFGDGMSSEARALVVMMGRNIRSSKAIGDALNGYYDRVEALGSPGQGSMFEAATPTKQDVFAPVMDGEVMYTRSVGSLADVVKEWSNAGIDNFVSERNGSISLSKIIVPSDLRGNGLGTSAMQSLIDYADSSGQRIVLSPSADFGGDKSRLISFYKRFGFVENKGRNKDYTVSELMYREPRDVMYSRAAQTETPEFKKWFGDSKVIDHEGNPLVVYHGTSIDAGVDDNGIYEFNSADDLAGWFTQSVKKATDYANRYEVDVPWESGPQMYPAFLNIRNPLVVEGEIQRPVNESQEFIALAKSIGVEIDAANDDPVWHEMNQHEFIEAAIASGYDGIYAIESGEKTFAAFRPEQIKSAIGNNGQFDPNDPRITYSRGGSRSTVSDLTDTFRATFGKDADRLTELGRIKIVQSVSDLPARSDATPHPADVGGMFDPRDGMTYIVADNTLPSQIRGRVLHEIGVHSGFEEMLGAELYANVIATVDAKISSGDARFVEARRLATENAASPEHIPQETLAYLVENSPEMPLSRRILAAVRQWLYRVTGGRFVDLTTEDLVGMASAALRRQARMEFVAAGGEVPWYQIRPEVVRSLKYETKLPDTTEFREAVANTDGAEITRDGLLVDLVRFQKDEQSGSESIRTGVFYLPAGSPNAKHYRAGGTAGHWYGGPEKVTGQTLLKSPLFVKGATGGKAPEAAYDAIMGKGASKKLNDEARSAALTMRAAREDVIYRFLEENGADPDMTWSIIENSKQGNQLTYALQENVIAHAVRKAGYDSVVGYSKGSGDKGLFISEVFDVRETSYPASGYDSDIHPQFEMYSRQQSVDDFYRAVAQGDTLNTNDNPLITELIPTGETMEPIGLSVAKADANIETANQMQPGFMSAVECALVAGE